MNIITKIIKSPIFEVMLFAYSRELEKVFRGNDRFYLEIKSLFYYDVAS